MKPTRYQLRHDDDRLIHPTRYGRSAITGARTLDLRLFLTGKTYGGWNFWWLIYVINFQGAFFPDTRSSDDPLLCHYWAKNQLSNHMDVRVLCSWPMVVERSASHRNWRWDLNCRNAGVSSVLTLGFYLSQNDFNKVRLVNSKGHL